MLLCLCRHVAVIYIALCVFAFLIYAAPSSVTPLGSISKVRPLALLRKRQEPVSLPKNLIDSLLCCGQSHSSAATGVTKWLQACLRCSACQHSTKTHSAAIPTPATNP